MGFSQELETAGRLRRIETKVSRLLSHAGIEEGTTMPLSIEANNDPAAPALMHLQGFDITLSSLRRYLRESKEVSITTPLTLYIDGEYVGSLIFKGE
jgi:hypothetical protein